jgi:hypothetical protein
VNLRVYSGGRFRDVQVTAGKASDVMRLGNRFRYMMPGMDGMMNFDGPDGMLFGPETQMLRDRTFMREGMEPLMRDRIGPMLRERLNDLPRRIQIRAPMPTAPVVRVPMRISPLAPLRLQRIYRVDASDIEPVSADVIRELVATTIRNAQSALKQLAADGIS